MFCWNIKLPELLMQSEGHKYELSHLHYSVTAACLMCRGSSSHNEDVKHETLQDAGRQTSHCEEEGDSSGNS